jgi:cell division protein ZapA (FtsZ GTPase activity inhibitor)
MKRSGKTISIKIGGSVFPITSPVSDVRIKQIEAFVNRKFDEIKAKNARLTFSENLMLTLLHITDLLIDSEEKNIRMKNDMMGEVKSIKSAVSEIGEFIDEKANAFDDEAG